MIKKIFYSHNTDEAGADKGTMSLFPKYPLYCEGDYLGNE